MTQSAEWPVQAVAAVPAPEPSSASIDQERLVVFAAQRARDRLICTFGPAPDHRVTTWNWGARRLLGYDEREVLGESIGRLLAEGSTRRKRVVALLEQTRRAGSLEREILVRRKDGTRIWLAANFTYLPTEVVPGGAYSLIAGDATPSRRRLHELLRDALHDPLTGLANRRLLMDRLELALSRAQRRGGHVATFMVDIDDFKDINDREGHEAGDRILRWVATALRRSVRPEDTVARLGGDEFVLICEDITDMEEVRVIGRRFSEILALTPSPLGGSMTASMGVVVVSSIGDRDGAAAVLRLADAAMYRAKRSGGATLQVIDQRSS